MLLKEYKPLGVKYTDYSTNYKKIVDIWNELKIDAGFKERYVLHAATPVVRKLGTAMGTKLGKALKPVGRAIDKAVGTKPKQKRK